MAISSAIAAILEANTDLVSVMAGRMYPDRPPHGVDLPAIVFTVDNIQVTETKSSTTGWNEVDCTITVFAVNRTNCETYAGYVRFAFNRITGTYGSETILTTNHRGESWDFIDDFAQEGTQKMGQGIYTQILNFRIVSK